jgi:hypothetical protein
MPQSRSRKALVTKTILTNFSNAIDKIRLKMPTSKRPSHGQKECSSLKHVYEFHLEGLSHCSPSIERASSNPRRQSKNIEMKYKTHIKLVHELFGTCFQYNVKNRASTV